MENFMGISEYGIIIYGSNYVSDDVLGKTMYQLLRFKRDRVVAILVNNKDKIRDCKIKNIDVITLDNIEKYDINKYAVYVGFAPVGGRFSKEEKEVMENVRLKGFKIVNGLHDYLEYGDNILNVRKTYSVVPISDIKVEKRSIKIFTLGTDYSNGKMTTTALINKYLNEHSEYSSDWLATGQTGVMLKEDGICIDSMAVDFMSKYIVEKMKQIDGRSDFLIIEGQGGILNPEHGFVSVGMLNSIKPDYYILVHKMLQENIKDYGIKIPQISKVMAFIREVGKFYGYESKPLGISINSTGFSEKEALNYSRKLEQECELPVIDVVKNFEGIGRFFEKMEV